MTESDGGKKAVATKYPTHSSMTIFRLSLAARINSARSAAHIPKKKVAVTVMPYKNGDKEERKRYAKTPPNVPAVPGAKGQNPI